MKLHITTAHTAPIGQSPAHLLSRNTLCHTHLHPLITYSLNASTVVNTSRRELMTAMRKRRVRGEDAGTRVGSRSHFWCRARSRWSIWPGVGEESEMGKEHGVAHKVQPINSSCRLHQIHLAIPSFPTPLVQLPVHTAHLHMGKEKQWLAAIAMFTASLASRSTNGCLLAEPFVVSCAERM